MMMREKEVEEQFEYEFPCVNEAWEEFNSGEMFLSNRIEYYENNKKSVLWGGIAIFSFVPGVILLYASVSPKVFIAILLMACSCYAYSKCKISIVSAGAIKTIDSIDNQFLTIRKVIARMMAYQTLDNACLQDQINNID